MSMSSEASEGDQRVTKAYVEAGGDQGLLNLLTDDTVFYVGGYPSSFRVRSRKCEAKLLISVSATFLTESLIFYNNNC